MPYKEPVIVYGGPYAHETDAITLESSQEKPNYDRLISEWNIISQGAHDYIESLKRPVAPNVGPFTENVVIDYDKRDDRIPAVADFDRDRETLGQGELKEEAPEGATNPENSADESTKGPKPSDVPVSESVKNGEVKPVEVDLDKL